MYYILSYAALTFIALVSFWFQAVVTEERLVPALNVFSNHFDIPGDVAGATIMAAGVSAPELFAMLISLFITHSSLGLGCIIGSEIFNQLVCCAGAITSAHKQTLKLDKSVVMREVSFYGLSLVLLLIALSEKGPKDDGIAGGVYFYISVNDGLILLAGYILYVLVCAYFEKLYSAWNAVNCNKREETHVFTEYPEMEDPKPLKRKNSLHFTTITVPSLPFLRQVMHEPPANFHHEDYEDDPLELTPAGSMVSLSPKISREDIMRGRLNDEEEEIALVDELTSLVQRRRASLSDAYRTFMLEHNPVIKKSKEEFEPRPSNIHGIYDVETNGVDKLSCFLWQQSIFYNKARVDQNAWQLRWFTFSKDVVTSYADRAELHHEEDMYPTFNKIEVDKDHLLVKLHPTHTEYRNYVLMAPSEEVLSSVVSKCEILMELWAESKINVEPHHLPTEAGLPLIAFPYGASILEIYLHLILLPFKFALHLSIPDVRLNTKKEMSSEPALDVATISTVSSIVWLVVSSYSMCYSLETLAALMNLPNSVMGVTVSAAGTSIPVFVASRVAARQGFGNMAVSNAFGSNSFNILFGFGLPWTLYTVFVLKGEKYDDLMDEGITESVVILAATLLIFLLLMIQSNFVLYAWHAWLFYGMYTVYVIYAVVNGYMIR